MVNQDLGVLTVREEENIKSKGLTETKAKIYGSLIGAGIIYTAMFFSKLSNDSEYVEIVKNYISNLF